MEQRAYYDTPLGILEIGHSCGSVTKLKFTDDAHIPGITTALSDLAAQQIISYLNGNRKSFDFPVAITGTAFQVSVWNALKDIPYGETRTYGQIAKAIGKPSAARAVGMACNQNPLWILIPCHRVLGKNMQLTGYAGGLDRKQALLDLEHQYR